MAGLITRAIEIGYLTALRDLRDVLHLGSQRLHVLPGV